MTITTFDSLGLSKAVLRALHETGYTTPTPIQAQAIPALIEGRDMLGLAQTGTGKTAAFVLPLLNLLGGHNGKGDGGKPTPKMPRALILAPTRELVVQIDDSIRTYGKHMRVRQAVVIGGVGKGPQINALRRGADIVVATPGRLLDLIRDGHCNLSMVDYLVLDEADHMFDLGFIRDLRTIVSMLPDERQSLLFSATMPKEIAKLTSEVLSDPLRVEIKSESVAVERIEQQVRHMNPARKPVMLRELMADPAFKRVIVFTRTKRGADKVVRTLGEAGVNSEALHGNKSQGARQKALENFRNARTRVLVATDIAARGIDVDNITHVINYDLPVEPESYVHRIGRTARAGTDGIAISFCSGEERSQLRAIERLTKISIPVVGDAPEPFQEEPSKGKNRKRGRGQGRPRQEQNAANGSAEATESRNAGAKQPRKPHRGKPGFKPKRFAEQAAAAGGASAPDADGAQRNGRPAGKPKRRRFNSNGRNKSNGGQRQAAA